MEKYILHTDIKVFGTHVPAFPLGIEQAFTHLMNIVPDGKKRAYYGLSWLDAAGKIVYIAAVQESHDGEAAVYNMDTYIIEKGDYKSVTLHDWMKKTDSMKDIFHEMMQDKEIDLSKPCIEWYKSDQEMMCMMKTAAPVLQA